MVLEEGKPLPVAFSKEFLGTDQEVSDLSAPVPETRWCLVEMPEEELAHLQSGKIFSVKELSAGGAGRGETGGCAVMCTATSTFGLEFLENTNSQFVVNVEKQMTTDENGTAKQSDQDDGQERLRCKVFGQCRGQMILKPGTADAQRVHELLAPHALGASSIEDEEHQRISTARLEYEVAASPRELSIILEEGPYVEHDGGWRLMPVGLERELLDAATTIVTARGWQPEAVDIQALFREIQQYFGDTAQACVPSVAVLRKALRSVLAEPTAPPAAPAETASEPSKAAAGVTPPTAGATASEPSATAAESSATPAAATVIDPSTTATSAAATVLDTSGTAVEAPARPEDLVAFDTAKVRRFRALQLLREPPSQLRDRLQLPPPAPRAKRARLGTQGATGGGRDGPPLQLEELAAAFQEATGAEASAEQVLALIGNSAYVDEFEGTVHAIDPRLLPQDATERLKRLFELQSHWKPERIAAFIAPALGKGVKPEAWLMKVTRTVNVEIERGAGEQRMIVKKFGGL